MKQNNQFNSINQRAMEKISWKQVRYNDRSGNIPSLRWGHSCCVIDDEVVYFGGYADSNYMNDVWSFNTITMEWKQIQTTGDTPSHRSNCSMNYDRHNNRVIVFGGGGANKKRFNSINILDWSTKQWFQITHKINEPVPWERTYHIAELFYPYLVIFGGEGISDLDDLWIFDFITLSWRQVPIDNHGVKPCPRRFHSSAKINNELYIIAGCHSKYRCLSDIYSIDLTSFLEKGEVSTLEWKDRKMKDNTFLTRWGHTSVVYDDKIYVYGGRFCNDLSDILVVDCHKNTISSLKVAGEPPKARRRHSACFLGSNMLIFGGFNGEYFNDLHYINIYTNKKKNVSSQQLTQQKIDKILKMKVIESRQIKTKDGRSLKVCTQLLVPRFKSQEKLEQFLFNIEGQYGYDQLAKNLMVLYRGYGNNEFKREQLIEIYQCKEQHDSEFKKSLTNEERLVVLGNRKKLKQVDPVIYLNDENYSQFLQQRRTQQSKYDIKFNINNEMFLKASPAKLALNSIYFSNILQGSYLQQTDSIFVPVESTLVFQTLVYYLTTNFVIVYKEIDYKFWVKLVQLAQYFSLTNLVNICQGELSNYVNENCCQELLVIGLNFSLNNLSRVCSQQIIKNMVNEDLEEYTDIFPELGSESLGVKRECILKQTYGELRFDILQRKIDFEYRSAKNSAKTIESQGDREQKQNYETSN